MLTDGKRVDYEYERTGTTTIFTFTEPLSGWYEVAVRERKSKVDWAIELANLPESRMPIAKKSLSSATPSTHTKAAFYEAFEPAWARQVDWQLKIDDAKCKLKSVYLNIKL